MSKACKLCYAVLYRMMEWSAVQYDGAECRSDHFSVV